MFFYFFVFGEQKIVSKNSFQTNLKVELWCLHKWLSQSYVLSGFQYYMVALLLTSNLLIGLLNFYES